MSVVQSTSVPTGSTHWLGRWIVSAHQSFEGRLKSSAPTWAGSSLRGGRHDFPDGCWMRPPAREDAVRDGGAENGKCSVRGWARRRQLRSSPELIHVRTLQRANANVPSSSSTMRSATMGAMDLEKMCLLCSGARKWFRRDGGNITFDGLPRVRIIR